MTWQDWMVVVLVVLLYAMHLVTEAAWERRLHALERLTDHYRRRLNELERERKAAANG